MGFPVSLAEVVKTGAASSLDDVFVARAGTVTAYDPLTNTIVVKPAVKHALFTEDEERVYEELPEIPFVPVMWPRAGGMAVTLPMAPGDSVLLVFCDVSHAEWRSSGEVSEPEDARRHSTGWPVAVPGFYPDTSPLSPDPVDIAARGAGVVIGEHAGNGRVEISPTLIKLGKDATDFVALAAQVQTALNAIRTFINGHTHAVTVTGSSTTQSGTTAAPTSPLAAVGPVAATRTQAK